MKILVCGSRNITDFQTVFEAISDSQFDVTEIISGGAKGIDSLAEKYAEQTATLIQVFKSDWNKFGKRAGLIRNTQMVDACDAVIAVWDGKSKGTDLRLITRKNIISRFLLKKFRQSQKKSKTRLGK